MGMDSLELALKNNPYDPKRGNESAYCRYLRYNVQGFYSLENSEVKEIWKDYERENMEKREYINKANFKYMFNFSKEELVYSGKEIERAINSMKSISEQEIVKPYLKRLKKQVYDIHIPYDENDTLDVQYGERLMRAIIIDMIDNLLSEQGESE